MVGVDVDIETEVLFCSLITNLSVSQHVVVSTLVCKVAAAFRQDVEKDHYGDMCYNNCKGMIGAVYCYPHHMDLFLRLHFAAADKISASGEIPGFDEIPGVPVAWCDGLLGNLKMQIAESKQSGFLTHEEQYWDRLDDTPGRNDTADSTTVKMTQEEVEQRFRKVRDCLNAHEARQQDTLIEQALMEAAGILSDRGVKEYLTKGAEGRDWNEISFIGYLLRIRAMAKSLFERPVEELEVSKEERVYWLKRWLWDREKLNPTNDQLIGRHVMFTLNNLVDGPFNESSKDLFSWHGQADSMDRKDKG